MTTLGGRGACRAINAARCGFTRFPTLYRLSAAVFCAVIKIRVPSFYHLLPPTALGLPSGYIPGVNDLVVIAWGPAGFWMGFIIGLDLGGVNDADALSTTSAVRHHFAARCAIIFIDSRRMAAIFSTCCIFPPQSGDFQEENAISLLPHCGSDANIRPSLSPTTLRS